MSSIESIEKIETYDEHEIELVIHRSNISQQSNCVVVLTHGIFTDRDEKGRFVRMAQRLVDGGFDVVRFNFRGHGNSPMASNNFTITGAIVDYVSVLNWIKLKQWPKTAVVGSSFGASIVLLEQSISNSANLSGLVLLNPVVDYIGTFLNPIFEWAKDIFSEDAQREILETGTFEVQPGFLATQDLLIEMFNMQPWLSASHVKCQSIVYHGDADDKVPLSLTQEHLKTASNFKIDVVPGAGHAFKDERSECYVHSGLVAWLKENINE